MSSDEAAAVKDRRKGIRGGLVAGVVIVVVAFLLLSRCGGRDEAPAASPDPPPVSSAPAASPTTPAGDGIVIAGSKVMLPLSGPASLKPYDGLAATSTSVPVQSVPADEGFWVGTSGTDRIWVELTGARGESPFVVKATDRVSFTGKVVANAAAFTAAVGVTDAEGARLLEKQQFHVAVPRAALKLLP